jgi:hypothetical protein
VTNVATVKPGSPLQRVRRVSVDRATVSPAPEKVDPHPHMDKAPVSRARVWDPSRNTSGQKPILKISLGPVAIVLAAGCTPWPFLSDPSGAPWPPLRAGETAQALLGPYPFFALNRSVKRRLCNTEGGRVVKGCAARCRAVSAALSRASATTNLARSNQSLVLRVFFGGAKSSALVDIFMICPRWSAGGSPTPRTNSAPDRGLLMACLSERPGGINGGITTTDCVPPAESGTMKSPFLSHLQVPVHACN